MSIISEIYKEEYWVKYRNLSAFPMGNIIMSEKNTITYSYIRFQIPEFDLLNIEMQLVPNSIIIPYMRGNDVCYHYFRFTEDDDRPNE
jgi:hypothetical protein